MRIAKVVVLILLLTGLLFGGTGIVQLYIWNMQEKVVVMDRQDVDTYSIPAISEETRFYPWTQFDRTQCTSMADLALSSPESYSVIMDSIYSFLKTYGIEPDMMNDLEAYIWLDDTYLYVDKCPFQISGQPQQFYLDFCLNYAQGRMISMHYYDDAEEEGISAGLSEEEKQRLYDAWVNFSWSLDNVGGEYSGEEVIQVLRNMIEVRLLNGQYESLVSGNEIVLVLEPEESEMDASVFGVEGESVYENLMSEEIPTILIYYSPGYQWIHGITIYENH